MGLRYPASLIQQVMQGVGNMKESTFYQMILQEGEAKGRADEARAVLLRLGTLRSGQPDEEIQKSIEAIQDVETIELLLERLLKTESWKELLAADNLR